jgi:Rrf2 family nitric oxide-sensitive transcriptional repressor
MITVSKKVEYSVELIAYLSKKQGKSVSLSDAAKVLNLPYRFLAQLALGLKKGGIVTAIEGKNGGYQLDVGWKKKNMFDLMESLGENKGIVNCLRKGEKCSREEDCRMRKIWQKIEKNFINDLKKIKLNEI